MQDRIDRLEGLVLSLMTNGAQSAGPKAAARALSMSVTSSSQEYQYNGNDHDDEMARDEDEEVESDTEQVAKSLGVLRVMDNKSMYVGDAHWAAILNDISEVRNYFIEHKKKYTDQLEKVEAIKKSNGFAQGPAFLFGGRNLPQLSELLEALPPKDTVDKLISRYFNDYDPAIHILHPPSWRRTYEKHWKDPTNIDPAWLGQIFAILCLTMHAYHRSGDEPYEFLGRTLALAADYRALTAQCLLLADFTKPVNYILETMVLHLHGEYARSREAEVGVWVLVGMVVRLAMRMGYHRDPKYYTNLTPFHGEMRRRVWTFVRQSDLLFSFQLALPSMIRNADCDTGSPRNIYDEEIDEDSTVLPPSRPSSSITPVSYMIAKDQLASSFGRILECLHAVTPSTLEEIMKLDTDLRENYAKLPPFLQYRLMEESSQDPIAIVMQRFNLSILYHKGQCVLHRKFLAKARENSRYAHSRRTCVDSSMELLRYQAILHYESRPGRRLHCMKWYISSLTSHDFLLAATLVCLDLWFTAEAERVGRTSGDLYQWGVEKRGNMMQAVQDSRDIWNELRDQSMEAFKAAEILGVMLDKLRTMRTQQQTMNPYQFPHMASNMSGPAAYNSLEAEKPEHSAALTLGLLSSGGLTPNSASVFNGFPATTGNAANPSDMQPVGMAPFFSTDQSTSGIARGPTPFSILTNSNAVDMPPTNLDWVSSPLLLTRPLSNEF